MCSVKGREMVVVRVVAVCRVGAMVESKFCVLAIPLCGYAFTLASMDQWSLDASLCSQKSQVNWPGLPSAPLSSSQLPHAPPQPRPWSLTRFAPP